MKTKPNVMHPISYSDVTHPSHLPLLFLATWYGLAALVLLRLPFEPMGKVGGWMVSAICSSHK